jgi:hypothetical protein
MPAEGKVREDNIQLIGRLPFDDHMKRKRVALGRSC